MEGGGRRLEERFVIESKVTLKNQVDINRKELKSLQILVSLVVLAAMGIAIYTLFEKYTNSSIGSQDIYNVVLTVVMLLIIVFLPKIASIVQVLSYKLRHLDGNQRIVIGEESFDLHREEGKDLCIKFSAVTRVIDRPAYIKIISGMKVMYLRKEDFTVGDAKALMEYLREVIE